MLRAAANTHTWQVREAVAAKISIRLRARAGTGAPETLTFSSRTGGGEMGRGAWRDRRVIKTRNPLLFTS
jgi:hypothetical protein